MPFLPLQAEFERIRDLLTQQALLSQESVPGDAFLRVINQSDYLITIHDVEYYRPICINERLQKFYGFDHAILKGIDHFYYLKTMHLSTYYTLIESMAFFRNDRSGYLNLKYKLLNAQRTWKHTIGASKAIIRDRSQKPKIAMTVMDIARQETDPSQYEQYLLLTAREREIVDLLCSGLSKKEIAHKLFISHGTVATHVKNIYRKLGVNKFAELSMLVDQFGQLNH